LRLRVREEPEKQEYQLTSAGTSGDFRRIPSDAGSTPLEQSVSFPGFGRSTLDFLAELRDNNERTWFQAHQDRYEQTVREPARQLVREMAPILARVAPHLVADDRKVGGSIMRPQRDTRFSPDKTPYKTNLGIQFRHDAGKDVHAPGLYLHLSPDELFVGLGMWRPDKEPLGKIRSRIAAEPEAWSATLADPGLRARWRIGGRDEATKRVPRGFSADDPHADDLKLVSHMLVADLEPDQVLGPQLPSLLATYLQAGAPHARFVAGAIGLPW
jgi:uncharacterized protein (TIGR02453 family)